MCESQYSMSPGRADQYRQEALMCRHELGFDPHSENVAPIDLKLAINDLQDKVKQRGKRLQLIRDYVRETDWMQFCRENPDAESWFDSDGVPV